MAAPLALLTVLADVPDPRSRPGRRHPLSASLSLAAVARSAGATSYQALAPCGRDEGGALARALGFPRGKPPPPSTSSALFRIPDGRAFEQALSRRTAARRPAGAGQRIPPDGKTARGSRGGERPGHPRVAAPCADAAAVRAPVRVAAQAKEHKAARPLLGIPPVKGNLITGDALSCQRDVRAAASAGGDYLFTAEDDRPSLVIAIGAGLAYPEQARRHAAAGSPGRPAGRTAGGPGGGGRRGGARPPRAASAADYDGPDATAGLGGPEARIRVRSRADAGRPKGGGGGPRDHQPESRAGGRAAAPGRDAGHWGSRTSCTTGGP